MKKKQIILCLVIVIAGILAGIAVVGNEREKESPIERYNKAKDSEADESGEEKKTKFTYQDVEYEFLSYEVVEAADIATQTKYMGEYFFDGELPIDDPEELDFYMDYEAVKAESPELKELWENIDRYTSEKSAAIIEKNKDIIEKYTSMVHLEKRYMFLPCRLTNTATQERKVRLNEIRVVISSSDGGQFRTHDSLCYFDTTCHTEGDDRAHNFSLYTLQPNETLDCTIGFWIKDEIDNPECYFGITDLQLEAECRNPRVGKYMIKLSDLKEVEK